MGPTDLSLTGFLAGKAAGGNQGQTKNVFWVVRRKSGCQPRAGGVADDGENGGILLLLPGFDLVKIVVDGLGLGGDGGAAKV